MKKIKLNESVKAGLLFAVGLILGALCMLLSTEALAWVGCIVAVLALGVSIASPIIISTHEKHLKENINHDK